MKKLVLFCLSCLVVFTGCYSEIDDGSTDNEIIEETNETFSLKDYKEIRYSDLPDSIEESCDITGLVRIDGYLTDEISNDLTAGYLIDNSHGSVINYKMYDKCMVLDLKHCNNDIKGGKFVRVFGKMINDSTRNIQTVKSGYSLEVDCIQELIDVPEEIVQYDKFVNSDLFDALAKVIRFIGNLSYYLSNNETINSDNYDKSEFSYDIIGSEPVVCDFDKFIKDCKNDYSIVYDCIKDDLDSIIEYYDITNEIVNSNQLPDDLDEYYNGFLKVYNHMSESIDGIGKFS